MGDIIQGGTLFKEIRSKYSLEIKVQGKLNIISGEL